MKEMRQELVIGGPVISSHYSTMITIKIKDY